MKLLVSADWLAAELGAPDLAILDVSLHLPGSGRDARAEFRDAHIPGARFLDLEKVSDPDDALPHMLPGEERFARELSRLGIDERSRIVLYDNSPVHSAARAWWMLRAFGITQVALLDGGLGNWITEGRPVDSGKPAPASAKPMTLQLDRTRVATRKDIEQLLGAQSDEIVDARPAGRFAGTEAEPRSGLARGHIPGSRSLPQTAFFADDGKWKSLDEIHALFSGAGVDLTRPMVTTCGSGITAAVPLFAAHLLGKEDVRLYDGSWSEWGADPALPNARVA